MSTACPPGKWQICPLGGCTAETIAPFPDLHEIRYPEFRLHFLAIAWLPPCYAARIVASRLRSSAVVSQLNGFAGAGFQAAGLVAGCGGDWGAGAAGRVGQSRAAGGCWRSCNGWPGGRFGRGFRDACLVI